MTEKFLTEKSPSAGSPAPDHRQYSTDALVLVQLDPATVVDCVRVGDAYLADDIVMSGGMRETCPFCKTVHLKMVLRQMHVKRAHMFCEQCTRCFDARYQDGSPALSIDPEEVAAEPEDAAAHA